MQVRQLLKIFRLIPDDDSYSLGEIAQIETKQPYSLEAADANAIEEVNFAYENVKEVECLDITKEGSDAWDAAVKRYEERIGKFFFKLKKLFAALTVSFTQIVWKLESLHIFVINWELQKMRMKCSASFLDSTRYSFGHTFVVLYVNIKPS